MKNQWILILILSVACLSGANRASGQAQTRPSESFPLVIAGVAGPGKGTDSGNASAAQPFDFDADGDVDGDDFTRFEACFTGPGGPPASNCLSADIDGDGHVDWVDLYWFQRCLSGANVPARPNCAQEAGRIPARNPSAILGKAFVQRVRELDKAEREKKVLEEILSGNLPGFLRKFVPVTVSMRLGGSVHNATYEVAPDVLAIGSDADFCRMPMTPQSAQKIADAFGCGLPTRKMSDDIYAASHCKLAPHPFSPSIYRIESIYIFFQSNQAIETQRKDSGAPLGAFVGGIKKDVVIANGLLDAPGKVAIYGWHEMNGKPIQPLYLGHVNTWVDYSHGIRLVKKLMQVDGRPMLIEEVLADPVLCSLLSDEGVMPDPRYH